MIKEDFKNIPEKFQRALPIMNKLQSSGFEVYFVGGSLRDLLLNKPINDIDIATNALPEEVKKLFPHSFDTGIQHGTVTVVYKRENYEITTFRNDGDYLDHRHPENVKFVNDLREDLKRRDFSINALAMSPEGEIIDYYGGIEDLKNKIIKCVLNPYDRFEEDALRIFRAVRFTSQLNFSLENNTYLALKEKVSLLSNISIERIHSEFIKMMQGEGWQKGIELIKDSKIYEYMPDLQSNSIEKILNYEYKKIRFSDEVLIWAVLFILEIFPANQVNRVLNKWKTSNEIINNVNEILSFCQKYQKGILDYHLVYGLKRENIEKGIFILTKINNLKLVNNPLREYDLLPINSIKDLKITGNDLINEAGFKPGVHLGKMIKLIESQVLQEKLENDHRVMINFARENNV
ncbi:CCA tRNA nucleotidyltransferase [Xylocopilactobacillus apis]|uniref:CCA-adding enzyme n=1 Tax=Xylocopilactobacillus apis TaxID=2932183 RepID=A0AAU9DEF2_9LACO|nr:CCA tRNA nucleotidyltransferase [Xylocopilactobacillus apis]BDR56536.1 CCA-adding enzyme [Xylocopilactobacillus apis]